MPVFGVQASGQMMTNPSGTPAQCAALMLSANKPIAGTIRVDYGPGATAFIGFSNPHVTYAQWPSLTGSYRGSSAASSNNSKIMAIARGLDLNQIRRMEDNALWRAQGWAFLIPIFGRILATDFAVTGTGELLIPWIEDSAWHISDAIAILDNQAKSIRDQMVRAGCDSTSLNLGGTLVGTPFGVLHTELDVALGRMGMTCLSWRNSSKDPVVRARIVQLSLQVNETEAAAIRDRLDAYCVPQQIVGIQPLTARGIKPSGSVSDWWKSEPIVFTSKNYVVGGAVGLAVGAFAMHLSMKMKKR